MNAAPRTALDPTRLGRALVALAAALLLVMPLVSDNDYYQNMIILSLVMAVGASGLGIITGLAGSRTPRSSIAGCSKCTRAMATPSG